MKQKQISKYKTAQEIFWTGRFGDNYMKRNRDIKLVSASIALLTKIFSYTRGVNSLIEFGANIGNNLLAIKSISPHIKLSAVEINKKAVLELKKIKGLKVYHQSILDFKTDYKRDLVLVFGLLIHLNPKMLDLSYNIIYRTSKKYICLMEYYNPNPVEVCYRGHKGKLFKRDFAGEMLDKFKKLKLIDYGFAYHRDNNWDFGDGTWFLLEK
jgi:spore coat polysaccharide biosynthesis protein SpsF